MTISSSLAPYLASIVPIEWWKSELQNKRDQHVGPASIVLVTAILVTAVWGKFVALSFLALAVMTYPFSHRQIRYFMHLEVYGTMQAAAGVAIPLFCAKIPLLSAWAMPLHVALSYSMLTRMWRLCQLTYDTSQEIEKLQKSGVVSQQTIQRLENNSRELEQACRGLEQTCRGLEQALDKLLIEVEDQQHIGEKTEAVAQQGEAVVVQILNDYERLNERLARAARLCSQAAETAQLTQTLGEIDQYEQKLSLLTNQCTVRTKELDTLTQQITGLKDQLQGTLKRTQEQETQSTQHLNQIKSWLSLIYNRKF